MSFTVQQVASTIDLAAGATISATFGTAIQPGETVGVIATYIGTLGAGRCSDPGGAYLSGATVAGLGWTKSTFYRLNHPGNQTVVTFTAPASVTNKGIVAFRISATGVITFASSLCTTQAAPGASADAITTGSLDIASADALIVAACINIVTASTLSVGTGFTTQGSLWSNFGLAESKAVSANTAATFTTSSGADNFLTGGLAFQLLPVITQNPSSVPKLVGDALYLDVLAAPSSGSLTYQWQDNSGGPLADMAGVTTQNISVSPLTVAMNGRQYRVKVTDANGISTSNTFTLAVSDRVDANYFLRDVPSDANSNDVRLYDRPDPLATGPVGTLAVTLDAVTVAAAGQALVQGALAGTLGDVTLAATGQALVQGTLAVTLGGATLAATGATLVQGTLAVTLGDVTLSATGTVTASVITGDLAVTLGDVTLAATGQALIQGTLATTLGNVTLAGAGVALVQGTLSSTLGDVTLAGAGTVLVQGALAVTLGDVTLAATGSNVSDPGTGPATRPRGSPIVQIGRLMS